MKHLVADWMTKHPLKIDINQHVEVARDIMHEEAIRHLLVIDRGNLVGVLSENDLDMVKTIRERFTGLDCVNVKITVGDLMSRSPAVVKTDTTMVDAIRVMNDKHIHSLPVIDEKGHARGILTSTDVMRYAVVASQHVDIGESYSKIMRGL